MVGSQGLLEDIGTCDYLHHTNPANLNIIPSDAQTGQPELELVNIPFEADTDHIEEIPLETFESPILSPSLNFINSDLFIRFDNGFLRLTMRLPYFELQDILAKEGSQEISSTLHPGETNAPALASAPVPDRNGLSPTVEFLASNFLNLTLEDATEAEKYLVFALARILPERNQGETLSKVRRLLDTSNAPASLQQMFEITAFLIVNRRFSIESIQNFFKWVEKQRYMSIFLDFLRIDSNCVILRALKGSDDVLRAAIKAGNLDLLKMIRMTGSELFPNDWTQLLLASSCENWGVAKFLVEEGTVGVRPSIILLASNAARSPNALEFAKAVLQRGPELNFGHAGYMNIEGWKAEESIGHTRAQIQRGVKTVLLEAVRHSQVEMVKLFLENGADPNYPGNHPAAAFRDVWLPTPLSELVSNFSGSDADFSCAALLLEHGASVKFLMGPGHEKGLDILTLISIKHDKLYEFVLPKIQDQVPPLTLKDILKAAEKGPAVFQEFIRSNESKITPEILRDALLKSTYRDKDQSVCWSLETTVALLRHGADPNVALQNAVEHEDGAYAVALARCLVKAGATTADKSNILRRVIERGRDFQLLRVLLDAGADLELEVCGVDLLMSAVREKNVAAAALLLDRGVPIDIYFDRFTPLQVAAGSSKGDCSMVKLLLRRGADVNFPAHREGGMTALQAACDSEDLTCVKILIEQGADVNAEPAELKGITALNGAIGPSSGFIVPRSETRCQIFQTLLDHGADPVQRGGGREDAVLLRLGLWTDLKYLKQVLDIRRQKGADPNEVFLANVVRFNGSALQFAPHCYDIELLELLVEYGADIHLPAASYGGATALQNAACCGYLIIVKYLLDRGADVNAKPAIINGLSTMGAAAVSGSIPVAELLLKHGADINARSTCEHSRDPLEEAVYHGNLDMVYWLIEHGATGDLTSSDPYGKAIEIADSEAVRHPEIAKYLRSVQLEREITEQVKDLSSVVQRNT